MQTIALVDYGSGNIHSAQKALERAAGEADTSARVALMSDPDEIRRADRIVLPGVGAFADCRAGLDRVDGLVEALRTRVLTDGVPFLGICVGMQLLAERGLEFGETPGLGWVKGAVTAIAPDDPTLKVPHMGWNTIDLRGSEHPLFADIATGPNGLHAYFVHSFHMTGVPGTHILAVADYGGPITAAVGHDNIAGTQFHPEKSQTLGLQLLANFVRWRP